MFFSYDDLNDGLQDAGYNTGSIMKKAANSVADFSCKLYNDYPWAFTQGDLNPFNKGIWDSLCEPRLPQLPMLPVPPFEGGQCVAKYRIIVGYSAPENQVGNFDIGSYWGSIGSVTLQPSPSGLSDRRGVAMAVYVSSRGTGNSPGEYATHKVVDPLTYGGNLTSVQLIREDGQPDNCGNPTSEHPQTPIPSGRASGSESIKNNDGTSFPITIVYAPITGKVGADFIVNGGIHFHFGLGGVTVTNTGDSVEDGTEDEEDNGDGGENGEEPPSEGDGGGEDEPEPPEEGGYTKNEKFGGNSGDVRGINNLHWVAVTLSKIPTNAKRQNGLQAYDLYYAGWFQFIVDGKYLPREPVSFQRGMFKCPKGATGYAYTLYQGYECSLIEYVKEDDSNGDSSASENNTTG